MAESVTTETKSTADTLLTPEFMAKLARLGVISRKILAGKIRGERRSRKRGHSLEFADHRAYAQGDDLRRIDWNLYGRLERLFLKLFLEEEDLSVYVLVDRSTSMNFGAVNKFEYAKRVAAAVGYVGMTNMDRVAVDTFAGDLEESLDTLRGRQVYKLFRFLEKVRADGATDLTLSVRNFLIKNRRPGICLLLSDFLDPKGYEAPVKALAARRMDTFAVHILAQEEVEPVLAGDFRLRDSETGEVVDISASKRLLESYQKTIRGFCASLQEYCTRRGVTYILTTTAVPFEQLVLQYLRNVGLVK